MKQEISSELIKRVIESVEKKATGYDTEEVVEEYTFDDNLKKDVLVKKKVSKFKVPADITAAKFLIDLAQNDSSDQFEDMSDEQLDQEVLRLFKEYQKLAGKQIFIGGEELNGD